jgi:hypothetical protein
LRSPVHNPGSPWGPGSRRSGAPRVGGASPPVSRSSSSHRVVPCCIQNRFGVGAGIQSPGLLLWDLLLLGGLICGPAHPPRLNARPSAAPVRDPCPRVPRRRGALISCTRARRVANGAGGTGVPRPPRVRHVPHRPTAASVQSGSPAYGFPVAIIVCLAASGVHASARGPPLQLTGITPKGESSARQAATPRAGDRAEALTRGAGPPRVQPFST